MRSTKSPTFGGWQGTSAFEGERLACPCFKQQAAATKLMQPHFELEGYGCSVADSYCWRVGGGGGAPFKSRPAPLSKPRGRGGV